MTTAIQPAATQPSLNDLLRDRVRGFLAEVLPDEMVKSFTDQAVKEFIEGVEVPEVRDRWGNVERKGQKADPECLKLVRDAVKDELTKRVLAVLAEAVPRAVQGVPQEVIEAHAAEVLQKIGPELLKGVIAAISGPVISSLQSSVWQMQQRLGVQT